LGLDDLNIAVFSGKINSTGQWTGVALITGFEGKLLSGILLIKSPGDFFLIKKA